MQDARGCLLDLQKLATSRGSNRDQLLERVTDLFLLTSDTRGKSETIVFGDAMERIAYELEMEARARLAERLAESEKAPRKLIVRLASDEIGVARPVLEKSPCLTDDDLVSIAENNGQDHLHAITNRPQLSPAVTDVITDRGNDEVLTNMASNQGAEFSNQGLEKLTARARANCDLFSALEVRTDVPKEMLTEIKRTIAVRLWSEVNELSSEITGKEIDDIVDAKARELFSDNSKTGSSDKAKPANERQITEEMVVAFARARKLSETIQCLSLMSGISSGRISNCLLHADLSALAVLCKALDFRNTTFASLIHLRSASSPLHVRIIADAMRHYDMLKPETARRTIESVRNQSEKV